jgi:hypothetical protein
VLVAGDGERTSLRAVAQHGDASNSMFETVTAAGWSDAVVPM